MSKRQIIMALGALTIILALFSGFPGMWNTVLYVIIGVIIIATAYLMKPARSTEPDPAAPYIEHSTSTPTQNQVPPPSLPDTSSDRT